MVIAHHENVLKVCNEQIEHLTHPEIYGYCLDRCNSIVINKERMMTITTNEQRITTHEFAPLYPTYFSPKVAREIVMRDVYKDVNGKRIPLEIINKLEYYQLLKASTVEGLNALKNIQA